jgi:NAD-dependent dihydropyrimidine dehydrogenase PreA subunit
MIPVHWFWLGDAPRFVDSGTVFCQAVHMLRLSRKFAAVLLAVWLPLFSGNALAASIGMQANSGDCDVMQPVSPPLQHDSASHQHMHHHQLAANQEQQNNPHHQQHSSCNNCGVCQLACSGYLAAVTINVSDAQPAAQSFTLSATQFQSFTSAPLDPPPLALA